MVWVWHCAHQTNKKPTVFFTITGCHGHLKIKSRLSWVPLIPLKVTLAWLWSRNMKAKCTRLALASPNWRHSHGLDRQCWQRIPSFNYGVVTMDTTYSMPISITLHMALCEGHTTSEIQLKAAEMKAVTLHALCTIRWWEVMIKLTNNNWILSCMSHESAFEYSVKLKA